MSSCGDERFPLPGVHKELPESDGGRATLAEHPQPLQLFGREGVLKEVEAVRLQLLGQPDGLNGRKALVDVVEQLDLKAYAAAQVFKKARHATGVRFRIEMCRDTERPPDRAGAASRRRPDPAGT